MLKRRKAINYNGIGGVIRFVCVVSFLVWQLQVSCHVSLCTVDHESLLTLVLVVTQC